MKIDIITLFPDMFKGVFNESIIKIAQRKELVNINTHNLRNWSVDRYKTVDDKPYGGGPGMIIRVDIIYNALISILGKGYRKDKLKTNRRIILLDPTGEKFNQKKALKLSKFKHLIFICGHYEGVDNRVREHLIDEQISIGDYILTGGELPTMVIIDSVVRLISGVLGKNDSIQKESFSDFGIAGLKGRQLLEYPQYTRPENFKGWKVPDILLSGNHREIEKWKEQKSLELTKKKRSDLLQD